MGKGLKYKALATYEEDHGQEDAVEEEPSLIHDFLISNITVNSIRKNLD